MLPSSGTWCYLTWKIIKTALDEHPNPSSRRKIFLPHIIASQETVTLTAKEFLWFENMNKLWQQQGKG
jgi:hypothetical protein